MKEPGKKSDLGVTHVQTVKLRGIRTESGHEFDQIEIAYQTHGSLTRAKDNVILVCHAFSGDAHVAGNHPQTNKPGWWDDYVGPGKPIDTKHFFVVCANVLGGCAGSTGPASKNPRTGKPYAMDFPPVSIRDMVAAQKRLLDHLGIPKLLAVVGGSMGGMQALAWAVDYPDFVDRCISIAACMAHEAMQIGINEVGRQAIMTDPNWQEGQYTEAQRPEHGLAVARMVGHVTFLSSFAFTEKFGRRLQGEARPGDTDPNAFAVARFLQHQGESFVKRFDPNSYLYLTNALDHFDLFGKRPAAAVLQNAKTRFLVISFASDWLYPPEQSRKLVRSLRRANVTASYLNLDTPYGHDSFLIPNPELSRAIQGFLENEPQSR